MKFFSWTLKIVIALLGIGLFLAQSQTAKKSTLEYFLNMSLADSSYRIEIEGVRGLFPFQFEVTSLEIKDEEKDITTLSDIAIIWSVPALMSKKIKLSIFKGKEIGGELIYRIDKHNLFVALQGEGLPLGEHALLRSIIVDLPTLDILTGKITVNLTDDQKPIALSLLLEELDEDHLNIKDIDLTGDGLNGNGHLTFHQKQGTWEGQAALSIENLSFYNHWFNQNLEGSLKINCLKKQETPVNLNLSFNKLAYGNFKAQSLAAKAIIETQDQWNMTIQSHGTLINDIPFTQLSATTTQDKNQNVFELLGKGPQNISLQTKGTLDLPTQINTQTKVTLSHAELTHPLHQVVLKQPATFIWSDHELHVPKLSLTLGKGTISIQDAIIHEHLLSGDIFIDQLPLTLLRVIHPEWKALGYLSGKGKVRGTMEKPEGELSIEGKSLKWGKEKKRLKYSPPQQLFAINLSTALKVQEQLLTWQISLDSGKVLSLTSKGKLALNDLSFKTPQSLEGNLKGAGDLGALSVFIANGDLVKGNASLNLTATGTTLAPKIKGHVSLTKGLYENAAFGTLIRNITLQANASNDKITISSITGQDNTKGRINGHATIKLTSLMNPEVDLQLILSKLMVLQNDEFSGRVSGTLNLQGAFLGDENRRAKINGDITLHPLDIHLEDHSEELTTIKLLEKKRDGTYKAVKKKHQEQRQEGSTLLPLDIKISSPSQIYVRGYGLESQWKGDLRAIGTLSEPQLTGEIALVRGKFDLLGKPLKLQEGRITFSQEPINDPILLIVGTREIGEVTATMRVDGRASDPKIAFLSNPALPQEEVLARLLFGRGIESMSITQSLLLANALRTFKGKNNLNFTDKLRSAFGLDVLEFKERKSEDGDDLQSSNQLLSVGKQITDKVYLSLDQTVSGDGGTAATIQYDVTSNLKVEADVGGDKNTGVGFAWVKKY